MLSTILNRFQPNQNFGKQLVVAVELQHALDLRKSKALGQSIDEASQLQTSQNISSRILKKRRELEETLASQSVEEINKKSKTEESIDFDSVSFIGRTMLNKLGWKPGSALGRSGGSALGPVEVEKRTGNSGVGSRAETIVEVQTYESWKKMKARYDDIVLKESKN